MSETLIETLRPLPLFRGLTDDQLHRIADIAVRKHFSRGEQLFDEQTDVEGFFILLSGRVKVYKLSPDGREQVLKFFNRGESIAEVAVFAGESYPAYAEAIENSTALFILRGAFLSAVRRDPDLAINMLAVLARRLLHFTRLVEDLSLKDVTARLSDYILRKAGNPPAGTVVLNVSKNQLATLLSTTPETLSRTFAVLSANGVITVTRRSIEIHDHVRLAGFARGEKN